MSKRARSGKSQNKHDGMVEEIATDYRDKGYHVWADDIPGFADPDSYHGRVPDVVAEKNGHITLVEVETYDSVNTKRDKEQRARFKSWASRKSTRHFRREVV